MEWTEARKHSFIVSILRGGTRRYPPKYECLNAAKTKKKTNKLTGRMAQHYRCAGCRKEFPATGVSVDHIKPVVGPEGFISWDLFIANMFCTGDGLQVLCTACHLAKSKLEKENRASNRATKTVPPGLGKKE